MGFLKKKSADVKTASNRDKAVSDVQTIGAALSDLGHVAADQARLTGGLAADKATTWAQDSRDWAQPRLEKAGEALSAAQQEATDRGRKAVKQGRKAAKQNRKQLEQDYIPRIQRALQDASDAAKSNKPLGAKAQEVGTVTKRALTEPTPQKKAKKGGKVFGWVLVGALAAGAGYMLWRRTQPTEDPWAEEYWDDAATATPAPAYAGGKEQPEGEQPATEEATEDAVESATDDPNSTQGPSVTDTAAADPTTDATSADEIIGDVDPQDGRKLGSL